MSQKRQYLPSVVFPSLVENKKRELYDDISQCAAITLSQKTGNAKIN